MNGLNVRSTDLHWIVASSPHLVSHVHGCGLANVEGISKRFESMRRASSGHASIIARESRLYSVIFHGISGLVHGDHFTASLVTARRIAIDGVDSRAAKFAEVRDENGNVVLRYPDEQAHVP